MTVEIEWMKNLFCHEPQIKKFKDEISCIEWCRKNYEHIFAINGHRTLGNPVSHFEVMETLRRRTV